MYVYLLFAQFTGTEDYQRKSITVMVPADKISVTFTIIIINDDITECDEMFSLMLSIPTPPCEVVIRRDDTSEVMIRDDDGRRSLSDYVVLFIILINRSNVVI